MLYKIAISLSNVKFPLIGIKTKLRKITVDRNLYKIDEMQPVFDSMYSGNLESLVSGIVVLVGL
jgi:hypothetical protein